jgi:hypothetical protein
MMSQEAPKKRYYLFILAIVILVFGGVALFAGASNFPIRSVGIAACMASVYLVRISNVSIRSFLGVTNRREVGSKAYKRPKLMMWIIGGALLVAVGAAFVALYGDAIRGYHEILPVYIFSGAAIICISFWSYLISKML